jgi:competence protein ComEC
MPYSQAPETTRTLRPFGALLGWVAGSAAQLQQSDLWPFTVYTCLLLLGGVFAAWAAIKIRATFLRIVVVFLGIACVGFGMTGLRAVAYVQATLDPALEGRDVLVTAVVSELPQRNTSGLRFRLDVESATLQGQAVDLPPRIDVGWYGGVYPLGMEQVGLQRPPPADVRAGERWTLLLRLKAGHGSRNPGGFDYELYLWEQGVQATAYVRAGPKDPVPRLEAQTWQHPVAWARQAVRDRIFATIEQRPLAGVVAALVVGDQSAIERADWDVFRATGVAHLVSISGLHITMFAWLAMGLVGWLWRRSGRLCLWWPAPNAALLGGLVLALAYSVFSGWGVPAQRTCTMLAAVVLLRLYGARWPWPQVWMLACAAVVVWDPWALLQPGFWLSFVAVGVLFASNSGATYASQTGATGRFVSMLREQWVISVALAPLTLLLFGQVSLVGLVANLLAIPWVTLVLTPLAMLGTMVPELWAWAAHMVHWLMIGLQWFATWPLATWSMPASPWWLGFSSMVGGLLLVMPGPWWLRISGLPVLVSLVLWRPPLPPAGQFELLAADVGQGNAVLVRTANHALLYDTGPRYSLESDAGHRVLVPLLQHFQTRLDRIIVSHRDSDHSGGLAALLAMQPQAEVLTSMARDGVVPSAQTGSRCEAGQQWMWDGVQFEVLHPQAHDYDRTLQPNALSCVLRISTATQSALLVGDIEQVQEAAIVSRASNLQSKVLLVPHHGSKTSSSAEFLDTVSPRFALVQSGYRNRFGHPTAPVVERYLQRGITVLDSPHCGAMTWQSWASDKVACERSERVRYWQHNAP